MRLYVVSYLAGEGNIPNITGVAKSKEMAEKIRKQTFIDRESVGFAYMNLLSLISKKLL